MIPCVWFVSKTARPWERALIGNMASAFRARGAALSLYVDGGVAEVEAEGAQSWNALTGIERISQALFSRRRLWHLWGEAPLWWGLVRLHSRTVHTSFEARPSWRGHPTRFFPEPTREGEALLIPTFNSRISRIDCEDTASIVYLRADAASRALAYVLRERDLTATDLETFSFSASAAGNGVFLAGPSPSDALRAAALTMYGWVTAGLMSTSLNALLGGEGYVHVSDDTEEAWSVALETAVSAPGRAAAAAARHFIQDRCSADRSVDSLIAVYSNVLGDRFS